jgi:hypothetical protein
VNTGRGLAPDVRVDRVHPAARLSPAVRFAAATTLVLGAGLQAASWLVYAGLDLAATCRLVASGAGRPDLSLALNTLATPFWIAGVAAYVLLGRIRSPRLAWIGGTLLMVGLTGLATNHGTEIMTFAQSGQRRVSSRVRNVRGPLTSVPDPVAHLALAERTACSARYAAPFSGSCSHSQASWVLSHIQPSTSSGKARA